MIEDEFSSDVFEKQKERVILKKYNDGYRIYSGNFEYITLSEHQIKDLYRQLVILTGESHE